MRGGVAGHVVVPEAVLILVVAEHVGGLGAAAALVFHVDIFHIAIGAEYEAHDQFITTFEAAADGFELRAFRGVDLGEELLGELQRGVFVRGDFGNVFHVLPVHAAPRDAFVMFGELDVSVAGLHVASEEPMLVKAGAGFDVLGLDLVVAHGDFYERIADERVGALQQQRVARVGGGFGGLPILRLLLLEQPNFGVLERIEILRHFVEGFDHHRLRFDGCAVPPMAVLEIAPEEPHFLIGHGAFLDGFNDELGESVVVCFFLEFADAIHRDGHLRLIHSRQAQEVLRAVFLSFYRLIDEVFDGHTMLCGDGAVFQEEGAAIEILRDY